MLTNVVMTLTMSRLGSHFRNYENEYSESLCKVAAGKNVSKPFDGAADYFHAANYNRQYSDSSRVRSDTAEVSAMLDVASRIGEQVYDGLSEMKSLAENYYDPNASAGIKEIIAADFKAVMNQISAAIDNGYYDGKKLVSDTSVSGALKTVNLDPKDFTKKFSIDFDADQVADPTGLTLGVNSQSDEMDAIMAELEKAGSYLGRVAGYSRGIDAQYNIANTQMISSKDAESAITDADVGTDITKAVGYSIRYQATAAMMAQANALNASIVKVLGN